MDNFNVKQATFSQKSGALLNFARIQQIELTPGFNLCHCFA